MSFWAAAATTGLDIGSKLWQHNEDKKARDEARKTQKENRRREAIMNLISVAGGQGVKGMSPQESYSVSSAGPAILSSIGQGVGGIADTIREEQAAKVAAEQAARELAIKEQQANASSQQAAAAMMNASTNRLESFGSGLYNVNKGALDWLKLFMRGSQPSGRAAAALPPSASSFAVDASSLFD